MSGPGYHPRQSVYFDKLVWTLSVIVALISLLGFLGRMHWRLDLLSHFRVQYFQTALLFAGICLWVRRGKCAMAFLAIAAFNYAFILPLYMGKTETSHPPVRAMLVNLDFTNGHTDKVMNAIQTYNPDLLLLLEVTPTWAFELSALSETYPFHMVEPREGHFGLTFLSRFPLSHNEIVKAGTFGIPSVRTTVHLPQGEIVLIGTHPPPPVNRELANHRNNQLAALAKLAEQQTLPVLLLGDLNTTPWSPYFRDLLKESGLNNSMKGFGFQPTWPTRRPFVRIPIDHVLHDPEIEIHNRTVGPEIGSDHLPVLIEFSIR